MMDDLGSCLPRGKVNLEETEDGPAEGPPSSVRASRDASLVVLLGVQAGSSAGREAWLSDESWRAGASKIGVPALLMGLEKLNCGRGSPEASEATEGERWNGGQAGEKAPLLEESLRELCEWIEVPNVLTPSSSVDSSGDDIRLEDRLVNNGRGGTRPAASNEFFGALSGELVTTELGRGD